MKLNTPLVTLLSGAALGVGVLVASVLSPSSTPPASGYAATPPASASTAAALPSPASSSSAAAPASAPASAPSYTPATAPASVPASGPAAPSPRSDVPSQADFVGKVDGGGAAVAISVHGDKAVAYVCNGHAVAAWLRGTVVAGKLDLTGKNGARLSVDYRTEKAVGFIMADGTKFTFSAPAVHRVSSVRRPPGLYEAVAMVDGVPIKAGWIVLPDGSQVGSVEYDPSSAVPPTAQAPLLDPATGASRYDGVTLAASLISGVTGSGF